MNLKPKSIYISYMIQSLPLQLGHIFNWGKFYLASKIPFFLLVLFLNRVKLLYLPPLTPSFPHPGESPCCNTYIMVVTSISRVNGGPAC